MTRADQTSDVAEVLDVANGQTREDVTARARQSWEWANECRARFTSILDMSKRSSAVVRAVTWAEIMEYLDDTGEPVFDVKAYREWRTLSWWQSQLAWFNLLNPAEWARGLKAFFGTKPIVWYHEQDQA